MFWEQEGWSGVDEEERGGALAMICSGLPAQHRDAFALPDGGAAASGEQLMLRRLRVRRLRFYPDHWIYELDLASEALGLARYRSARAFIVTTPSGPAQASPPFPDVPPHRRTTLRAGHDAVSSVLLDWTSGGLQQLTARAGMQLVSEGKFDQPLALEYLDYFVSFISTDKHRSLFLLLRGGTLAHPQGIRGSEAPLPSFEQAISDEQQLPDGQLLQRPPRYAYIPEDPTLLDEPDLPASTQPAATGSVASASPPEPTVEPADHVIDAVAVLAEHTDRHALEVAAVVLHEDTFFRARFEIACSADATLVTMLEDDRLGTADPALLQYQLDQVGPHRIWLLLAMKPRAATTAADFLGQVRVASATSLLSPAAWVENLRVSNDVNFQLLAAAGPIRVRDVEFLGRVVLDECRRDGSVVFERCRFARSFEARNSTIDGDLVLRGSTVLGVAGARNPLPSPSVCLTGLHCRGDLDAEQLIVDGEVAASNAKVVGTARLRGIDIRGRRPSEQTGLSLRRAELKAGLDLSPHREPDPVGLGRPARSRVEGTIDLTGLRAPRADLRGAVCGSIDLSYAQLTGLLDLSIYDPTDLASAGAWGIGNRLLCTRVFGDIDLRCAHAREIFLGGARIGANFTTIGAEIDGSVFAQPRMLAYRCRIGGSVTLSGARIQGDVNFDGALIAVAFEMRTGSLGRLFMSQCPVAVVDADVVYLDSFCTEVGRIDLTGIRDIGSIGMVGIQVGRSLGGTAAILLEHIESRGDIRFYWGLSEHRAFTLALQAARDRSKQLHHRPGQATSHPGRVRLRRQALVRNCRAVVQGNIEMRRIVTGGHVDLTHLRVDGSVRLNDARIGTDLFARSSWLRGMKFTAILNRENSRGAPNTHCSLALECSDLDLDNARIEGDALLSGIELHANARGEGRVSGRALKVGGKLEFFGGLGCAARIEGGIDLTGANASSLSLPGKGAAPTNPGPPRTATRTTGRPSVVLERCRLGKLSIARPIPQLDLSGIQVANWQLGTAGTPDHVDNRIAILERMSPMDRSVWIGVESELRNEARTSEADQVYRAMKRREPVGIWLAIPKIFSDLLYGYGTRVWPAIALFLALSIGLFALLLQPVNVKVSEALMLQLGAQCRVSQDRRVARELPVALLPPPLPGRCANYFNAIEEQQTPSIEITAARLDTYAVPPGGGVIRQGTGRASGYGIGDAMLLTLRYTIPFIGAFGDPDWAPAEQNPARIPTLAGIEFRPASVDAARLRSPTADSTELRLSPSIIAALVLILNSFLLSFTAAFVAKRWLR